MASNRSTPGTYTQNGVRCTMGAPFGKAASSRQGNGGQYGHNNGPFSKPQDTGNGGIPTKFYDGMSAKAASTVNAGMSKPTASANPSVGQRRFKNPK